MSDLDHIIDGILLDMEYRRATQHCEKGKVLVRHPEPTRDILRRALEPLVKERDELRAKLNPLDANCSRCGKAGATSKYCGRPYCYDCKKFEEICDEECT